MENVGKPRPDATDSRLIAPAANGLSLRNLQHRCVDRQSCAQKKAARWRVESVQPGGGGNVVRSKSLPGMMPGDSLCFQLQKIFQINPRQCTARRPPAGGTARGNQPRSIVKVTFFDTHLPLLTASSGRQSEAKAKTDYPNQMVSNVHFQGNLGVGQGRVAERYRERTSAPATLSGGTRPNRQKSAQAELDMIVRGQLRFAAGPLWNDVRAPQAFPFPSGSRPIGPMR